MVTRTQARLFRELEEKRRKQSLPISPFEQLEAARRGGVPSATPARPERPTLPVRAPEEQETTNEFIRRREKLESLISGPGKPITKAIREQAAEFLAAEMAAREPQLTVQQAQLGGATSETALAQLEAQAAETPGGFLEQPVTFTTPQGETITTTRGESLVTGATAIAIGAAVLTSVASLTAATVSTAARVTAGLFGRGTLVVGAAGFFSRTVFAQSRAAISDAQKKYDDIITNVANGTLTPEQAFTAAAELEDSLDRAERTGKMASANAISNFLTGGRELLSDVNAVRRNLPAKRVLLAQAMANIKVGRVQPL